MMIQCPRRTFRVNGNEIDAIPHGIDFHDIMLLPEYSTVNSRSEVTLLINDGVLSKLPYVPIIASNMDTIGTFEMAWALAQHSMLTCIDKHYNMEDWNRFISANGCGFAPVAGNPLFYIIPSFGIRDKDFELFDYLTGTYNCFSAVCIDVANCYTEKSLEAIREYQRRLPKHMSIIVGNVVDKEIVKYHLNGINVLKVGIGSGKQCLTRAKTGIGCPQATAIIRSLKTFQGIFNGVPLYDSDHAVMSDGGCRTSGDIVKAFALGADYVMIGSMLAGHNECGGRVFNHDGQKVMSHYGMSSETANDKYNGGLLGYRAAEGYESLVQFKGSVITTVEDILGGIRSACSYTNSPNIRQLKGTPFVIVETPKDNIL